MKPSKILFHGFLIIITGGLWAGVLIIWAFLKAAIGILTIPVPKAK